VSILVDIRKRFNRLLDEVSDYLTTGFSSEPRNTQIETTGEKGEQTSIEEGRRTRRRFQEHPASAPEEILRCRKCPLHLGRRNAVPGKGPAHADILFVGEGPGEMEDIQGEPFVGKAGQLLSKMISAIQLNREEVFITNVVKCRPPGNRTPLPEEVDACFPYLAAQIELIDPLIICCLGGPATGTLLGTDSGITKLRGTIHLYRDRAVIPTYHPAAVLRFPEKYKRPVWNDLKMLRDYYRDIKR
jgi:uracil-DNA glycosylase family 4